MFTPEIARLRHQLSLAMRRFFDYHGYTEIDLPILSALSLPESTIGLMSTEYVHPYGGSVKLDLLPSQEYYAKQLIAQDFGKIVSIGKAFRNGENLGQIHNPEFTMVEYYTPGFTSSDSLILTKRLLANLSGIVEQAAPNVRVMSMAEAFGRFADVDLTAMASPVDDAEALAVARGLCSEARINWNPKDDWATIFNRILLNRVEPSLGDEAIALIDYPARIATLAKVKLDEAGQPTPWAERWELYIRGIEIANCFTEETDPGRVKAFIAAESATMQAAGLSPHTLPQFPTICQKLGTCSGVALGWDRLLMVLLNKTHISEVLPFALHSLVK